MNSHLCSPPVPNFCPRLPLLRESRPVDSRELLTLNRLGPQLDADRPRVVAFGGGKGGAGRSTICAEMARSLAHRGHRVLCVDASWGCPTLNVHLNTEEPSFHPGDDQSPPLEARESHVADFVETTGVEGIWLASIAAARDTPFVRPDLPPLQLIEQLHSLDFDWVCLDLAPGSDPLDVGLFALSDIPLLVATPEPAAVRMATQFLRSSMVEALRVHPDAPDHAEAVRSILGRQSLHVSAASLRGAAPDSAAEDFVSDALDRLECYLVVNLVREGAEQDLGFVICHAWYESLSIFPRFLTSVDYENRRWFYDRRTAGNEAARGDETLSRDIESLCDMAAEISVVDAKYPRPVPRDEEKLHPALRIGISPDSSRNKVRQHCRRLWEGYKRERAVEVIFDDPEARTDIAGELESLYRKVLTLPSDTFDTVRDLEQPANADVGLSASSSTTQSSSSQVGLREESSSSPRLAEQTSDDQMGSAPTGRERERRGADVPTGPGSPSPNPGSPSTDTTSRESSPDANLDELAGADLSEISEPGGLVEGLRRRHSTSLQELSRRTSVGVKYLTAVEDADIGALPRPGSLREYLRKIAQTFDVDGEALIEAYLARLDRPL